MRAIPGMTPSDCERLAFMGWAGDADLRSGSKTTGRRNSMVIELIGGVGAGKSRILQILKEEYGAAVLETDQVARELEQPGREGCRLLAEAFGEGILTPEGEPDRKKLAELVFSDQAALERVNALIHPLVWEQVHRAAAEFRASAVGRTLLIVETAVPDKKPDDIYDEVWYVYTLKETRIQRLMESRGYSREKCLAVMAKQRTEEEYRALADRVIDNNGSLAEVRRQLREALG